MHREIKEDRDKKSRLGKKDQESNENTVHTHMTQEISKIVKVPDKSNGKININGSKRLDIEQLQENKTFTNPEGKKL